MTIAPRNRAETGKFATTKNAAAEIIVQTKFAANALVIARLTFHATL